MQHLHSRPLPPHFLSYPAQAYKQAVQSRIGQTPLIKNLLLQLEYDHKRKAPQHSSKRVDYIDAFKNSSFGKGGIQRIIDMMCDLAGISRRTNHGVSRRTHHNVLRSRNA